jgi:hypothetical protein
VENLLIIGCGDIARRADAAPCYHGDSWTLRLPNRRMKAELGA